ncbi:MAG: TlpA disulfide reductase family protein [Bryobacteraceae bacterium]
MRKLILVAALTGLFSGMLQAGGELSGRRAPGFALPDREAKYHDPMDYRGKILVLEVMQTNCPHCRVFSLLLEDLKKKYGDRIATLAIVNPPDNLKTVNAYISANKITTPILFDCGQVSAVYMKITPQNPSVNVPHVFIIDAQGTIQDDYGYSATNKGIFEGKELFTVLDRMLARAPVSKKRK